MSEFEGKVAVVTGAANGIGRATAKEFAARGTSVLLTDVDEVNGQEAVDELSLIHI